MTAEDQDTRSNTGDNSVDPMETNVSLLRRTQQFLQKQIDRQAPDSMLAQSWGEFYRVYNLLIQRFVLAHGIRGADADDCMQEVWHTVATKLTKFERPADRPGLRSWLYTVVRSKTTDFIRRKQRRSHENLDRAIEAGVEPPSREPDPADVLQRRWENALVKTVMEELRPKLSDVNFRILEMRLIEGRPEAEVAKAVKLTPEQVRYRKHRAQKKLQTMIAVYTGEALG